MEKTRTLIGAPTLYTAFDAGKDLVQVKLKGDNYKVIRDGMKMMTPRDLVKKYNPFAKASSSPRGVQQTPIINLEDNKNVVHSLNNQKLKHFLLKNNSSDPRKFKGTRKDLRHDCMNQIKNKFAYLHPPKNDCLNSERTLNNKEFKRENLNTHGEHECVFNNSSNDQDVPNKNIEELHRQFGYSAILPKPDIINIKRSNKNQHIEKIIKNVEFFFDVRNLILS